ncbi:MAG TPA: beta-propeller fold lactonase family protein [Terriglobales bacterium]|jgi:6-phosphogluconolactonase (cycloisomerase 2 family)|nr:beta-propeller fold lactonase family protein [Terriglobales bacterium]
MRLSAVYLYLAGSALLLSGCGNSQHIGCSGTDACVEQSFVYATTNARQVLIFPAAQNGTLSTPASVPGPAITGGDIAVSPPSHELFVGDHVLDTLAAFVLNGTDYQAAPGSPYPAGSGPALLASVTATPDGKFVYVVGLTGTISGFSVASNGSLMSISSSSLAVVPNSIQAVTDSAGKFLFVVGSFSVAGFAINSTTGTLISVGQPIALPASTLSTPGFAATTPRGNFLYVALTGGNSVAAFSFDPSTGALTSVPGSPFAVGLGPLTLTASASTVYVMNSVAGTISALAWDQTTGALSEIRGSPFDAQGASGGDIATLRGQYLYATDGNNLVSPNTDAIVGFTIDSSGALSPLAGSPFPSSVPLSGGIETSSLPQ